MKDDNHPPVHVVLHCPVCKKQHIDEGEWETRVHWSHLCCDDAAGKGCGMVWTPSYAPTFGVTFDWFGG